MNVMVDVVAAEEPVPHRGMPPLVKNGAHLIQGMGSLESRLLDSLNPTADFAGLKLVRVNIENDGARFHRGEEAVKRNV